MKKIITLTLFLLISGWLATAQQRECGMEEHMAQMMQDPEFARQWEINQAKFRNAVQQSLNLEYRQNMMDPIFLARFLHRSITSALVSSVK